MFSAYDIKKILPRAVFALVGISLSWALMNIFINIIGFLGGSIEKIIIDSFSAASSQLTTINLDGSSGGWFAGLAGVAIAGAALGLLPVLGLAMTGAVGIAIAFGIVLLRRVALVGLVVLAPLAIAMSVLPQTEKIFKEWWEWFSKLLLMYPFLMAMFAFSRVAAGIFSLTGGGGLSDVLFKFAAIAILIAPYFLVGKIFTLAGGTIAKLAGVVNNKDKGLIDKTKKWDQGRVAMNRAKSKDSRYAGNNFATAGLNAGIRRIMNPKSLASLNKQKRVAALVGGATRAEAAYAETYKAGFEALSSDGRKLLAHSKGTSRGAKEYIKREAETTYRDKLDELSTQVAAGRITQDQADVAAKMARRVREEGLERELAMLSSVGGVNATTARLGLKAAGEKGDIRMDEVDSLSSQLATATGTPFGGWDQRSRVMAETTSSSVGGAAQGAWQKKLDELTTKKAMADIAGETDVATLLGTEIENHLKRNGMRPLGPDDKPDTVEGLGLPGSKAQPGRQGFYTGSQSRSRVVVTDAVTKAAQAAAAGDNVALGDQISRIVDHAVVTGSSAVGAVGEKAVNPLNESGRVNHTPGRAEPERQGVRNEVIGKKDGSGR